MHVIGNVSISEIGGGFYLADRLFENLFGEIKISLPVDVCMPPHASSLELMKAVGGPRRSSSALDVGCGSGCLTLPLTRTAENVTGIDISGRSVAFARVNASLNSVEAKFEQSAWQDYHFSKRYDHIIFNSPDATSASAFVTEGIPKFLTDEGNAQIWLTCEALARDRNIHAAVNRLTTIRPPFKLRIMVNEQSPFSLSRDEIMSGKRPRRTLLVVHSHEWADYIDALRSRSVVEVASVVLDISGPNSMTVA
jgi:SAM-dependent methyltransferase